MLMIDTGHFAIFASSLLRMMCYGSHLSRLPMSGWENHRTCLEDYVLARHLQSILNIFFPVSHTFSPVSGSKRNPKEWKVREIFIHSFNK